MRRFRNTSLTAWRLRMYSWLGAYGTYIIGMTEGMGLMILFVMQGRHSVGTAFVVFQYIGMLNEQIELVTKHMTEPQKATAGLTRVRELLQHEQQLPARRRTRQRPGALS